MRMGQHAEAGSLPAGTPGAGQPRWLRPVAETKLGHQAERRRNTRRGIRSEEMQEVREWQRSVKRRLARQQHRLQKWATAQYPHSKPMSETIAGARGKEPKLVKGSNDIATLNVKTMVERTKRDTIENWMTEQI